MSGHIVSSGATFVVSSGVTDSSDAVIDPGSLLTVNSGGTTIGAWTISGGTERVMAGGVASRTTIAGGTLELLSGASAGAGPLTFSGTGGTLRIDGTAMPSNTISHLTAGDAIDLAGVSLASGGAAILSGGNLLVISAAGSTYDLHLDPTQDFSQTSFRLLSDGHGGTEVLATSGLAVNFTHDASVTSAPAGFIAAVGQAVSALEALIVTPVTLNLDLGYGTLMGSALSPGAVGQSEFFLEPFSYADVKAALSESSLSADQLRAYNTLLDSTPESGTLWLTTAQVRALGGLPDIDIDGGIGFSTSVQFSFTSGVVPPASKFYFFGVALHEMTEVMGRFSLLAANLAGSASYSVMDLFRYASAGALQTGSGAPSYFSIDGGVTNLHSWNNFVTGNHDDLGDWAQGPIHDAFDDRSGPGVINSLTAVDSTVMNVIGWQVAPTSVVSDGQTLTVSSGAIVSNVDVQSGGNVLVASGGTAYGTVISSGGQQIVSSGGHAIATVVSGGNENVLSGGAASGDFVLTGSEIISGTVTSTTLRMGGTQDIASGGVTNATFVSSGGAIVVNLGGLADGTIVLSGGTLDIAIGGSASSTIVSTGGLVVSVISSGQSVTVTSGQTISDAVVLPGGNLVVSSGGESLSATLSGGAEIVSSGGIAAATTIAGGTLELVGGAVVSGAIDFSATSGTLRVDGATMPSNTISDFVIGDAIDLAGVALVSGASATVSSGNLLVVSAGGSAYDLHLDPSQDYSHDEFRLLPDGHGGTAVEVVIADKLAETGLVDMSDIAFYQSGTAPIFNVNELAPYASSFGEIVLNLRWSDLEPTPGTLDTSLISSAISQVEAFNSAHGTDIGIKLRVYAGYVAPDWAKDIDGTAFLVSGNHNDGAGGHTIGRYWTADYINAWQSFQAQLAAVYDSNPIIRGISQTAGAIASDEPFVPLIDSQPLDAAGYTDAAEMLTLRAAISDYSAWATTPLDYTINIFWHQSGGRAAGDQNFPLAVLQQARNSTRLVQPGNHALQAPISGVNAFVYAQMAADAELDPSTAPGSFQTQAPIGLGGYSDWPPTLSAGVAANGSDIELWDGPGTSGFTGLSASAVQALAEIVSAGVAPTTYAPADGSALGFIAPVYVTASGETAAFTGTDALQIASSEAQSFYTVRVTLTSLDGGMLAVDDPGGIVQDSSSGTTITLAGPLALVNTVLAHLTDTASSGHDQVRIVATDIDGNQSVRTVNVLTSSGSAGSGVASGGDTGFAGQLGSNGTLLIGGVSASFDNPGGLLIGPGGDYTSLIAALSPGAYSTAKLTGGGSLEIASAGTARFTGLVSGASLAVDSGGVLAGNGALAAGSGAIINSGVIEAVADTTLGLQQLVVSNALSGSGTLRIDAGATLNLIGAVDANQTIIFEPNSAEQFADDPYAPSVLVLAAPHGTQPVISGFSFADRLVLLGVSAASATYSGSTLSVGSLTFTLPGVPGDLVPFVTTVGSGSGAETTIAFVAPSSGAVPHVSAPAALRGAVGSAVLLPDIVLDVPLPANASTTSTVTLTLSATSGTIVPSDSILGSHSLFLSGTVADIERSLQSVVYVGSAAGADTLSITISDFGGTSTATTSITNFTSSEEFDWASSAGGDFALSGDWGSGAGGPPGGADIAAFGSGTYTVSGNDAVGRILVSGNATLTGQVTAQGIGSAGSSLVVDSGGALTLAGGAVLTAQDRGVVGRDGEGTLVVMGGALDFTGASGTAALVVGEQNGGVGSVVNLETIAASGTVTVGQAGTGTLELLGVAATVSDGDAIIALSSGGAGSVTVNGGLWTTSGHLTVGAQGSATLLVDGRQGGIAGQVTAYDATFGAQSGGVGSVTLDGGEMLIANASASSSTLVVGGAGNGSLFIDNGGEVAVGVALATIVSGRGSNATSTFINDNGKLVVGTAAGGDGQVSIGTQGALLVYGDGIIAGNAGSGVVSVGDSGTEGALFALLGHLDVGSNGELVLAGDDSTVRATSYHIISGAIVMGVGTLSGDGGGNGTVTLAAIDNDSLIEAVGGELLLYGDVTGSGTLSASTGATLVLQSLVASSLILDFSTDATTVLNDAGAFSATITDFGSGDVLDLAGLDATAATWSGSLTGGVLTVDTTSGAIQFSFGGIYASNAFMVQSDGHGGTDVLLAPTGSGFVSQGETLVVSSGQSLSGIVVLNGGRLEIRSGGSVSGTTVRDGGTLTLSGGGQASGTALDPGSLQQVGAGYVLSGFTIANGVTVDVLSGGSASNTVVLSGGTLDVLTGGAASGTIASSGGTVLSGLGGGQTLVVSAGQTSSGIVVISDGTERVLSGGSAVGTLVSSGGLEDVLGQTNGTTLFEGGVEQVSAGGTASGTVISSGGRGLVSSGGAASGTVVRDGGELDLLSGGSARGALVSASGLMTVRGLASDTEVSSNGTLTVLSGGVASETLVDQGGQEIGAGGTIVSNTVASGGLLIVDSGSLASGTLVSSGGTLMLVGDGVQAATTFLAGANFVIALGHVESGLHVTSDIPLQIANGGTASAVVVESGGTVTVVSGGVAGSTNVQGGGSAVVQFGGVTIGDVLIGSGTHIAQETVSVGGATSDTIVSSGGLLDVLTGGLATGTIIEGTGALGGLIVSSGGYLICADVTTGGVAILSGLSLDALIESGGVLSVGGVSSGGGNGVNSSAIVESGGEVQIVGGLDLDLIVSGGGTETVRSGNAVRTIVLSEGVEILSGGKASGTTISNGGLIEIVGGQNLDAIISSGGAVRVSSGSGGDFSATVSDGGTETLFAGGITHNTKILHGGLQFVSSGGTASATFVLASGSETVLSGGDADDTVIFDRGFEYVSAGGTTHRTNISSGGQEIVSSGAVASGTVVSSGGTLELFGGGSAVSTTLLAGATLEIASGYSISGYNVLRATTLEVANGGSASAVVVSSGAVEAVSSGAVSATLVLGGGTVLVLDGGTTTGDRLVGSGTTLIARETVSSGGVASGTVLSNTGLLTVSSGGLAVAAVVTNNPFGSSGGLLVLAGGAASGATLSSGGAATVAGGTLSGTQVKSGASLSVTGGIDSAAIISKGGVALVSGGTDRDTTVLNGGQLIVSSGGVANHDILSSGGTQLLSSGASASGTQVKSGAMASVTGGIDSAATVSSGGLVLVTAGSDVGVTVMGGGTETVSASGRASGSILSSSGQQYVSSGGVASGALALNGGGQIIFAGGVVSATTVSSGGVIVNNGGSALAALVSSGGVELVLSSGLAASASILSGGLELVSSGLASAAIVQGGQQTILKGGTASATQVQSGGRVVVSSGGLGRATVVSSGGLDVLSAGGTASGTTVFDGGTEDVLSGAIAAGTLLSGGLQVVVTGGTATGTAVSSGALEVVSGSAVATVVGSGGQTTVSSGGTAKALTVAGGSALVQSGGAVSGAALSGGTLEIASGAIALSSTITFSGGGTLLLDDTKFRGKIANFNSIDPDAIDLRAVAFGSSTTSSYVDNGSSGTLIISDGTNTARLALIGHYVLAQFTLSADGHGGTLIVDPPVSSGGPLAPPH